MQNETRKMSAAQRGFIYAAATSLQMVDRNNPDDDLHVLVFRETGKRSLSLLTSDDAERVLNALNLLLEKAVAAKKAKDHEERPGGITADQQKKVWRLMYLLREADPSPASLGDRLCGIITRQLKVDCTPEQPFRFVTLEGGWKLIEALKHLLKNVENRNGGMRHDA